jgi:hypothetical protein
LGADIDVEKLVISFWNSVGDFVDKMTREESNADKNDSS